MALVTTALCTVLRSCTPVGGGGNIPPGELKVKLPGVIFVDEWCSRHTLVHLQHQRTAQQTLLEPL
jgi:hypothetical protein